FGTRTFAEGDPCREADGHEFKRKTSSQLVGVFESRKFYSLRPSTALRSNQRSKIGRLPFRDSVAEFLHCICVAGGSDYRAHLAFPCVHLLGRSAGFHECAEP